ncbi:MAG: hypothetical protein HOG19_00270, partial [Gammaproteobacteria bacterium]|nr:hypothetical protein [Gammaproteobacteria bacterium]
KQFQTLCAQGQLLSNTALPQFLITAFNEKKLFSPAHIILLGFQHMPPLQQTLLEATGATIRQHSPSTVATVTQKLACDNGVQEFHAAADWAKRQLESNPHKRIGIIVPDLAQQRSSIESVLASVFEPQYLLPDTARYQLPFNISAGTPLNQTPLIDSALLLLGLLRDEFTYHDLYGLLKSPFVKKTADDFSAGNGTANFGASTQLEIFLRAGGWPVFTLKGLQKQLNNQPSLNTQYQPFIRAIEVASGLQHQHQRETTELTEWVVIFETILSAFQWPCSDRRLDSIEYQQLTRWRAALLDFNQLSALSGKVSLTAALGLLERHIGSIDFQAQSAQTPLQVLGLLEGSGLQFDALWLIGTNDSQWPAAANPSPFIPINLQREANMPHASAERELEFARELLHSYCHSSNEIIASYALHSDDRALRASTLINDFEETTLSALGLAPAHFPHPYYQSHALGTEHALRLEVINETTGPIVDLEKESIRGGSSILKNQAACPFKAYAIHRLGAQQLPEPSYHLGPAQRGIALHSALESLWNTLKDSSQLAACHEAALDELLQQAVIKAIKPLARQRADLFGKVFSASESRRLSGLLKQWLAIEKTRDPFVVIATEKALLINLEGLPLRVRIDRIDRLEDGSLALIDYKTGKCALNKWQGERLEEPQLPLYSVTFAGLEPESDVSTSNIQTLAFA